MDKQDLQTVAEMYAEMMGWDYPITIEGNKILCRIPHERTETYTFIKSDNLNILFEILEWWEGQDSVHRNCTVYITSGNGIVTLSTWKNGLCSKNVRTINPDLSTAIIQALAKIKES